MQSNSDNLVVMDDFVEEMGGLPNLTNLHLIECRLDKSTEHQQAEGPRQAQQNEDPVYSNESNSNSGEQEELEPEARSRISDFLNVN